MNEYKYSYYCYMIIIFIHIFSIFIFHSILNFFSLSSLFSFILNLVFFSSLIPYFPLPSPSPYSFHSFPSPLSLHSSQTFPSAFAPLTHLSLLRLYEFPPRSRGEVGGVTGEKGSRGHGEALGHL